MTFLNDSVINPVQMKKKDGDKWKQKLTILIFIKNETPSPYFVVHLFGST